MLKKIKSMIFGPDYSQMQKNFEDDLINLQRIEEKAEAYYRDGDFYCSESIVKTFIEEFKKFVDEYDRLPNEKEIDNQFETNIQIVEKKLCRLSTLRRRLEKGYYNFA